VFAEVRRVLAPHGTLWLNLGDSYNAYNGNRGGPAGPLKGAGSTGWHDAATYRPASGSPRPG
jgi:hypothetical protein